MKQDHTIQVILRQMEQSIIILECRKIIFTDAEIDDYYAYISEKASETSGECYNYGNGRKYGSGIDSEWLGTFTDSGRLEISYRD